MLLPAAIPSRYNEDSNTIHFDPVQGREQPTDTAFVRLELVEMKRRLDFFVTHDIDYSNLQEL